MTIATAHGHPRITGLELDPTRFRCHIVDPQQLEGLEDALLKNDTFPLDTTEDGLPSTLPRIRLNHGTLVKNPRRHGHWYYIADQEPDRGRHMPTFSRMSAEADPKAELQLTRREFRQLMGPARPELHLEPMARLNSGWLYLTDTATVVGRPTGEDGDFYVPDSNPDRAYFL